MVAEPDSTAVVVGSEVCDSLSGGWRVQSRFRFLMKGLTMRVGLGGRLVLMMVMRRFND